MYRIIESRHHRFLRSPSYNFNFDKKTGFFMRWGRTTQEDTKFSPFGPEILDLEISVNGCPNGCAFCYKANTNIPPTNMTFATFKQILDKMPKTLTQIAFGITGIQTNPDFVKMLKYCRKKEVVPNFTLTGIDLTDDMLEKVVPLIGAVAVSAYKTDKNVCYDTVKKFINAGIKQTNIHLMVSDETEDFAYEVFHDIMHDDRLKGLNAVVLLGLKPKGRAKGEFHPLPMHKFEKLMNYCLDNKIPIGFDSCSAQKFEAVVRKSERPEKWKQTMLQISESCESSLFSAYINVKGEYWHCSFSENETGVQSVSVLKAKDFVKDVWNSPEVMQFRARVLATEKNGCRKCVTFSEVNI